MMQINLLPWREQARQIKKRRFATGAIGCGILAILLLALIHLYLSSITREQGYINGSLQNEVNIEQSAVAATHTQQIEKAKLERKMQYVIGLYGHNYDVIDFLNEIAIVVPQNIFLNRIIRSGKEFTLGGYASSNTDVTTFVDTLKKSHIVDKAVLTKITSGQDVNNGRRIFEILVTEKKGTV
jgi:type IV pilus assembly protein PilN